ncbi:hypothetical protein HRI_002856800 [Hibiscus trionum]|uniref:Endonuclease/exonuclease/phosphatase domain-containing protein n=1 Tax=Hibiscus trionum TaxID=183268 RepID=A0A9W7I8L6_HIBTR|nr:hypothetical protein HRI_002856800 [Hibiscus trionum]
MNIMFWNTQGARSAEFRRQFRNFVRSNNPQMVALFEPRVSYGEADRVIQSFGYPNSFRVEARGFSGGVWLLWRDGVDVTILSVSNQFVHGKAREVSSKHWIYFTAVYASPNACVRRYLWDILNRLSLGVEVPWVLGGDFNAILRKEERCGGSSEALGTSSLFQKFIDSTELTEIDYKGDDFTWCRGNLYQRLDRCLANSAWLVDYPMSIVVHLDRVGSDHCPLLLKPNGVLVPNLEWHFRFLAAWQDHPDFRALLESSWDDSSSVVVNAQNF